MCRDPGCIFLAELASQAVDFAKSGTPVDRDDMPKLRFPPHLKPDWATGEVDSGKSGRQSYKSQRAIGHLFRRIDLTNTERIAAREAEKQHQDPTIRAKVQQKQNLEQSLKSLALKEPAIQHPISAALQDLLQPFGVSSSGSEETIIVGQELFDAYVSELRYICSSCKLGFKLLTEEEVSRIFNLEVAQTNNINVAIGYGRNDCQQD